MARAWPRRTIGCKRFDLADRAYAKAIRLVGATPEILNNQGFSYMLRGDYARARTTLLAAQAKDPASPYIQNNLQMLDESCAQEEDGQLASALLC